MSNVFLTRLGGILIIALIILLYLWGNAVSKGNAKEDQLTKLLTAVTDTLKTVRNKDSSQTVSINSLTVQSTKQLLSITTKDSTINSLQSIVKQYEKQLKTGGTVVVVKGDTKIIDSTKTIVIKDSTGKCPEYRAKFDNPWYKANLRMKCDSSLLSIKIINAYNVVIGKEKNGTWFADITNKNPFSSTETMRVANVEIPKQKIKRFNVSIFGGYGINLKGTVQATPFIGAGISYTLIPLF